MDVDGDGVERLCAGALSAEEVAGPIVDKLELSDMTVDWVWICLLALWQRWWPDRVCLELLDHKMQAGYALDAGSNTRVAALTWLSAWSDVLRLCDATGISSIEEFDDRFPLTQSLYNWIQDLEMALENAGRDDRRPEADTNAAAGDLFNRGIRAGRGRCPRHWSVVRRAGDQKTTVSWSAGVAAQPWSNARPGGAGLHPQARRRLPP